MALSTLLEKLESERLTETVTIFSAAVGTGTISTGTNIDIKGMDNVTILIDMTGSLVNNVLIPTIEFFAGVSGFNAFLVRQVSGVTADQNNIFKLGAVNASTGGVSFTTGISVFNTLRAECHASGTVSGGDITFRIKAVLPRI